VQQCLVLSDLILVEGRALAVQWCEVCTVSPVPMIILVRRNEERSREEGRGGEGNRSLKPIRH
jgi:hypothetical protein